MAIGIDEDAPDLGHRRADRDALSDDGQGWYSRQMRSIPARVASALNQRSSGGRPVTKVPRPCWGETRPSRARVSMA